MGTVLSQWCERAAEEGGTQLRSSPASKSEGSAGGWETAQRLETAELRGKTKGKKQNREGAQSISEAEIQALGTLLGMLVGPVG